MRYLLCLFFSILLSLLIHTSDHQSKVLTLDKITNIEGGACTWGYGNWIDEKYCTTTQKDCGDSTTDDAPTCVTYILYDCRFKWESGCSDMQIVLWDIGEWVCGGSPNEGIVFNCDDELVMCENYNNPVGKDYLAVVISK